MYFPLLNHFRPKGRFTQQTFYHISKMPMPSKLAPIIKDVLRRGYSQEM